MESRGDGGPFQVTPEQGRALAAHLREQNVRLSESLSKRIFDTDFLKSMQRFAAEATAEVVRNLQPIAASMVEHFRASLPDNWKGFDSVRQIGEIFDVMESTGWCLAWVPREEIVRAILAEDADGRSRVLLAHWNEVVADIQELLEKLQASKLAQFRASAIKATAAYRGGHPEAAQALAASTRSALIQSFLGHRSFEQARLALQGDPWEAGIGTFRQAAVFNQVALSLQRYFVHKGDNIPESFSRHRTAHA